MRPARRKKGSQGYRHFLARAPSDRRETAHPLRGTQGTLCPWVLFSQTGLRLGEPWRGWGAGCDMGLQRCTQSMTPTPALRGPWGGQEGESLLDSLSLSYANLEEWLAWVIHSGWSAEVEHKVLPMPRAPLLHPACCPLQTPNLH